VLEDVDLIVEAGPENADIKIEMLKIMHMYAPEEAIITTNSMSFVPEYLAARANLAGIRNTSMPRRV